MALNVVDLYSEEYINELGTEYISTGFMFDTQETEKELPEQMASFDFLGADAPTPGTGGPMGPSGMAGGPTGAY